MRKNLIINRYLLIIVVLIGFGVRLQYVFRSMRFDEALTIVEYGTVNPLTTLASYTIPNNHIFHSLLVNLSYRIGGLEAIFMRLPVLMAGILLIVISYAIAKRIYRNHYIGLLTALLIATSPALIDYSVSARGYEIQAVFTMLLFYIGHRLKQENNIRLWLLLSICAALSFFTLPTTLYSMGIIALWLIVSIWFENRENKTLRRALIQNYIVSMILGAILTVLSYALVIIFTGLDKIPRFDVMPMNEFLLQYPKLWEDILGFIHWGYPSFIIIFSFIFVGLGVWQHYRLSRDWMPIIFPALVWLIFMTLLQRVFPFSRVWLFLIPLYLIFVAAGVYYLLSKFPRPIIIFSYILLSIIGTLYTYNNETIYLSPVIGFAENAEEGAFYLSENVPDGESVLMSWPTNYPVIYYVRLHNIKTPSLKEDLDNIQSYYYFYHLDDEIDRLIAEGVPAGRHELVKAYQYGTIEKVFVDQ